MSFQNWEIRYHTTFDVVSDFRSLYSCHDLYSTAFRVTLQGNIFIEHHYVKLHSHNAILWMHLSDSLAQVFQRIQLIFKYIL